MDFAIYYRAQYKQAKYKTSTFHYTQCTPTRNISLIDLPKALEIKTFKCF